MDLTLLEGNVEGEKKDDKDKSDDEQVCAWWAASVLTLPCEPISLC